MITLTPADTEHLQQVLEEAYNCIRNEQIFLERSEELDEQTEIAIDEMQLACDALESGMAVLELRTGNIVTN